MVVITQAAFNRLVWMLSWVPTRLSSVRKICPGTLKPATERPMRVRLSSDCR